MTVADARISTAFPSHPKTKKLIRRLGPSGAWALVCLFLWVASNRSDGDLSGMTDEDIELAVNWGGAEGALVSELANLRFLDGEAGARRIHDWAEHNPWAVGAGMRSSKARWNAAKRHYGEPGADRLVPEYAAVRVASSSAGSSAPSPSPSPSPIPIPSPIPTFSPPKGGEAPRRRSATPVVERPVGVAEQTWTDWLALRKAKKAPVTATVLAQADRESEKAGLSLEDFLAIWCARGSQGLLAEWIKPEERQAAVRATPQGKTYRERDMEHAMRRWEEMHGQPHPDRDRYEREAGLVIEAAPADQKFLEGTA